MYQIDYIWDTLSTCLPKKGRRYDTIKLFTGRQFAYDRALSIIQDEEYLEDVDFNEIRRYDILKKIGEFDPNVNVPRNHQQWMAAKPATPYNKRPNYQRHKPQLKASKYEEVGDVHSYNKKNANLHRQKYTY